MDITFSFLAVVLALGGVALVSLWSSNDNIMGWLGAPSWDENLFALHPIMLVGGFFPSMVLAISIIIIFEGREEERRKKMITKYLHISLQLIGVIFFIIGVYAIFEYKKPQNNHLNVAHSWLGVITIIGLFCNMITGIIKSFVLRDKYSPTFRAWDTYHGEFILCITSCFSTFHLYDTHNDYIDYLGVGTVLAAAFSICSGISIQQNLSGNNDNDNNKLFVG